MRIIHVDRTHPEPEPIGRAAAVLRRGGLVAFPTETVYGLGANALDEAAVRRIFEAKGRPSDNPLIVHVSDHRAAAPLVRGWPPVADRLAAAFWPGPLTLVLPKHPGVPDIVTAGLPTVAIRVPSHPVALALLRAADVPVAAPSANPFTAVSPTSAEHVRKGLGERVDLILDGGPTTVGIESTVLDLSGDRPALLRPGMVSIEELTAVAGRIALPSAGTRTKGPRPAPGMHPRHYAPRAKVRIFGDDDREGAERRANEAMREGRSVGAILRSKLDAPLAETITMPDDPAEYGQRLYAALHTLDDVGCDLILIERVPDAPEWAGVRDRLDRASR